MIWTACSRLPCAAYGVGLLETVDGADVRMAERREHLHFACESRSAMRSAARPAGRIFIAASRPSFLSRAR
jgi:hypothetical protein